MVVRKEGQAVCLQAAEQQAATQLGKSAPGISSRTPVSVSVSISVAIAIFYSHS